MTSVSFSNEQIPKYLSTDKWKSETESSAKNPANPEKKHVVKID